MAHIWQEILGTAETHLTSIEDSCQKTFLVHKQVASPLKALLNQAESDGISIAIVSCFRSFDQQLNIWNQKWLGHRPVFSRHGRPLNVNAMSDVEKYKAICLWSALPSMSRHHWGTDLDIFDARAIENGHQVELTPQEFSGSGPCGELEEWLQLNLAKFKFFRPYSEFRGGVSCEPWHISYRPAAAQILQDFQLSDS
ncbi:MAG: M15 family metallopeptidase, partial [Kangiellaceae bacterium]|nr:M15 family metallopeptidase [Kangiellaceae bacterium]